ncbi:galactose oxidase [Flagellimonas allohymeniacidonis]|uniref:Galactose oxidase n=2 Tax=Flagellimonas allohymeniacidonis TaxID=2517819 RepID=A0A4Q8QCS0_9FLAO|nr:galactose oxidase [Allomuricauda hymeniacidonis]
MLFPSLLILVSCSSDDEVDELGNWVERSVLDGTPRSSAAAFTLGDRGFMGTGYDGDDYLNDFWIYDIEGNFWSQGASFPGIARSAATSFTINGVGYVGLGFDGDNELGDFYSYNADNNTWTQIADFGGSSRRGAVGFGSSTNGYVGTGFDGDNDRKDFWKYDPVTDQWSELIGFGGTKRRDAAAFTINGLVYFGTGTSNGRNQTDFWVFDSNSETWTPLLDIDDDDDYTIVRSNAVGFSIGDKGYFACGNGGAGPIVSVWEYDPTTDLWEEKTAYEGIAREGSIAFYNGTRAFLALGRSGNLYLDDNREFFPFEEEDEDD